jgi:hypothetical protein
MTFSSATSLLPWKHPSKWQRLLSTSLHFFLVSVGKQPKHFNPGGGQVWPRIGSTVSSHYFGIAMATNMIAREASFNESHLYRCEGLVWGYSAPLILGQGLC